MYGIDYLRGKLASKRAGVNRRYKYYEMKNVVRDLGISTPPQLRGWFNSLGWCATAVDEIADRIVFDEFGRDDFGMSEIYENSNRDILIPAIVKGALIGACDFIYITTNDDGYPLLQVIDAYDATGVIDTFTQMLSEGYAVLSKKSDGTPRTEAYFLPGVTQIYENGKHVSDYENSANYALLVPVVHRPDAKRPFGHSRISRACMSTMDSAIRTIKRSEVAAEFFSFPQRWVTGIDRDAEKMEKWRATMSSLITFTKDADGKSPTLGQFQQQSMAPHAEQLKMFASVFAAETGLTLSDLGFETSNPASVESLKASHDRLRRAARAAQNSFAVGIKNAGFLAACVRDDYAYDRALVTSTEVKWAPTYEVDGSALVAVGDAITKINSAVPGFFDAANISDITGIKPAETSTVNLMVSEDDTEGTV